MGRGKQGKLREAEPWHPQQHSQEGVLGHAAVQLHGAGCQVPRVADGDPDPTDSGVLEAVQGPLHRDGSGSHIADLKAFHRARPWPEQAQSAAVTVGHPLPSPCAPKGGPAGISALPSPVEQLSATSPTELMLFSQSPGSWQAHLSAHPQGLGLLKAVPRLSLCPSPSSKGAAVPRPGPNHRIIKAGRDLGSSS